MGFKTLTLIKGLAELKMIINIITNLRHGETYNKYQIGKASGNKDYFYGSNMLEKLLLNGFFVERSSKFRFDRKKLFEWYENNYGLWGLNTPFKW